MCRTLVIVSVTMLLLDVWLVLLTEDQSTTTTTVVGGADVAGNFVIYACCSY